MHVTFLVELRLLFFVKETNAISVQGLLGALLTKTDSPSSEEGIANSKREMFPFDKQEKLFCTLF